MADLQRTAPAPPRCPRRAEPKGRTSAVGVLWDFSGTSGFINRHEHETTERRFAQVSDKILLIVAGHRAGSSLPGHLTDGCRRILRVLHESRSGRGCGRTPWLGAGAGQGRSARRAGRPSAGVAAQSRRPHTLTPPAPERSHVGYRNGSTGLLARQGSGGLGPRPCQEVQRLRGALTSLPRYGRVPGDPCARPPAWRRRTSARPERRARAGTRWRRPVRTTRGAGGGGGGDEGGRGSTCGGRGLKSACLRHASSLGSGP